MRMEKLDVFENLSLNKNFTDQLGVCLDHFAFCVFVKESSIFEVLNVD